MSDIQKAVSKWLVACFGSKLAKDKVERNHRYIEESLELVQACGCSKDEVLKIVDYVYSRDVGERQQELGGAMTTLFALADAYGDDLEACAKTEIDLIWQKIDHIRAKREGKPDFSHAA